MADNDGNGDGSGAGAGSGDDGNPTPPAPIDLDAVHDRTMGERGEELSAPEKTGDDSDEEEDGDGDGDGSGAGAVDKDNDEEEDGGDDDGAGDGSAVDEEEDGDGDATPPAPAEDSDDDEPEEPTTEVDVTKPGKYKATFVDEDGKEFHVNNMEELPDDFEPRSQKEFGKAIQDLTKKQQLFEADQQTFKEESAKKTTAKEITNLKESWNTDIEKLTKDGKLPKDAKERDKVVVGVYKLMDSEMKKGRVIDSWEHAFEIYSFRQGQVTAAEEKKNENQDKKNRGGKVMGSGSGGAPSKPKVYEAPPPGVTLDMVHEKTLGSL